MWSFSSNNDPTYLNQYKTFKKKSKVDLRMVKVECDFVETQAKKNSFKVTDCEK